MCNCVELYKLLVRKCSGIYINDIFIIIYIINYKLTNKYEKIIFCYSLLIALLFYYFFRLINLYTLLWSQ